MGKNAGRSGPLLLIRTQESERSLAAGSWYLIGRDPQADVVIPDARVSWQHAMVRLDGGRWILADNGSTNGTYADGQRVDRIEITGECLIRLGDPADGPALSCTVNRPALPRAAAPLRAGAPPQAARPRRIGRAPDNDIVVSDPSVSSYHAELHEAGGVYRIVDLGSHNGTFVNEQRVTTAALSEGDVVGLGDATYQLGGRDLREFASPDACSRTPNCLTRWRWTRSGPARASRGSASSPS